MFTIDTRQHDRITGFNVEGDRATIQYGGDTRWHLAGTYGDVLVGGHAPVRHYAGVYETRMAAIEAMGRWLGGY